jgi:NitT/TauT family transport system permease protein
MKVFTSYLKKFNLFSILFWLVLWQIFAVVIGQPLYLPMPISVLKSLCNLVPQLEFWRSIIATFYRVVMGFFSSVIMGIVLGIIAAKYQWVQRLLQPLMTIIKATPIMSIIILALVWLKATNVPIFTCIILCLPIIYTNVLAGINNIDHQLIEMSSVYQVKLVYVIRHVIMPSLRPYIFSAMMVCVGFSWKSVVTAEVLSSPKFSMGYNLYATKIYLDISGLFAWTAVIIVFSVLLEKLVHILFDDKRMKKTGLR